MILSELDMREINCVFVVLLLRYLEGVRPRSLPNNKWLRFNGESPYFTALAGGQDDIPQCSFTLAVPGCPGQVFAVEVPADKIGFRWVTHAEVELNMPNVSSTSILDDIFGDDATMA